MFGAKAMASHTAATAASGVPVYSQGLGNCVSTTDWEPHLESKSRGLSTERMFSGEDKSSGKSNFISYQLLIC